MRLWNGLLVLTAVLAWGTTSSGLAGVYAIDPAHTHVGFTVQHIFSKVLGQFKTFDGVISFDEKEPSADSISVTIQTSSIDTNNEIRDKHLQSPDFFDAAKNPTITFVSVKVKARGDKKYKVEGNLTLHGVTKRVIFTMEYLGQDVDPYGNQVAGFSANTTIDRRDFGLVWNKTLASGNLLVGNNVDIDLEVSANLKK
jgi:polyisoprenoid-binding protein YceI